MPKKYAIGLMVIFSAFVFLSRIMEHPWNFSPMGAFFIFSGFALPRKWMWFPVVILSLTDLIIGAYQWQVMMTVYATYSVIMVGASLLKRYSVSSVLISSIGSAILFFITTNFAHWLWFGGYARTFLGLSNAYISAIPFFRNSLAGYVFYTSAFFCIYESIRLFYKKFTQDSCLSKKRPYSAKL